MRFGSLSPTLEENILQRKVLVMKVLKCKSPGHSIKMSFIQNAINKLVVISAALSSQATREINMMRGSLRPPQGVTGEPWEWQSGRS